MKTDKEISVIIFSSKENFLESTDLFKNENIKIVGLSADFMRVKSYMVLYKGSVIVSDEETIGDRLDEVLSYTSIHKCSVLYCSKRYVPNDIMKKYNNFDIIYSHQYPRFDEFIKVICKKVNMLLIKNIGANETTSVLNSNINTAKPSTSINKVPTRLAETTEPVRNFSSVNEEKYTNYYKNKQFKKVIAIGASTGGPDMILKILKCFPGDLDVPVFVVQHMPEYFTKMFADRMDKECEVSIVEPADGDPVLGGCVYVAPGGKQMIVRESRGEYFIRILPHDKNYVNNPAVDVMFDSICSKFGARIIAAILTGMGKDGAKGMLNIRNNGGYTIGQDAESSVVYGMQKVAYEMGAVRIQLDINEIGKHILSKLNK